MLTRIRLSQDAAIVLGLARTAVPFACRFAGVESSGVAVGGSNRTAPRAALGPCSGGTVLPVADTGRR